MSEEKANQSFSYTGSIEYYLDDVILSTDGPSSLNTSVSGVGGIGAIPPEGATVTMKTGTIAADPNVKDLQPSLNNGMYYLLTNEIYDQKRDKDLVISLATKIPVSIVGGSMRARLSLTTRTNIKTCT